MGPDPNADLQCNSPNKPALIHSIGISKLHLWLKVVNFQSHSLFSDSSLSPAAMLKPSTPTECALGPMSPEGFQSQYSPPLHVNNHRRTQWTLADWKRWPNLHYTGLADKQMQKPWNAFQKSPNLEINAHLWQSEPQPLLQNLVLQGNVLRIRQIKHSEFWNGYVCPNFRLW